MEQDNKKRTCRDYSSMRNHGNIIEVPRDVPNDEIYLFQTYGIDYKYVIEKMKKTHKLIDKRG